MIHLWMSARVKMGKINKGEVKGQPVNSVTIKGKVCGCEETREKKARYDQVEGQDREAEERLLNFNNELGYGRED
jgi:hypothetical protein